MTVSIEILRSHTPEGSACDGEFASATFKVLSTQNGEEITHDELQQRLLAWNIDCQLHQLGYLKGTRTQAGRLGFVDCDAPDANEIIVLEQ